MPVTDGAKVDIQGRKISVSGKLGSLAFSHRPEVEVKLEDDNVVVTRHGDNKAARAFHGLTRSLIQNMIEGVTKGFVKELEVSGVGYVAAMKGPKQIDLKVGFADTRSVKIPDGVTCEVNGVRIRVSGSDKQLVGQTAAAIRAERKPEPYNGKGIRYIDEVILRKQGKAFAK
ncbi:large subunit ribosomal protein L6 [Phycisphaera mikurensis]|nr:large subunit ribosomal protein L6 [Phycisphaera mikurensis]